ncbi:MAG: heavy metal-binding domain-containing protein [Vampirovibrio sp.]|nr:heavy metal-binding domain-containing protein [Vampirovibrio sp.]
MIVVLATVGFVCGTIAEKKHYTSIKRRELKFRELPAVPIRLHHFLSAQQQEAVVETRLVTGCVVVSQDYFKMILANLKNFVGGSVSSYESLMDRARREAILRMKEQAPMADAIVNVRLESVTMGKDEGDKKPICSIQVLAYGTAVTLQR